jgi:hypothetical protein
MKNTVSGMLRRVAFVRTNVSVEHIASIMNLQRISELRATLTVTDVSEELTKWYFFGACVGC